MALTLPLLPHPANRPGWEDIFRMNQKQLEAAIRRVSNDPSLEPQVCVWVMWCVYG